MHISKIALLTSAFYFLIAFAGESVMVVIARLTGGLSIPWPIIVLFLGLAWAISFWVAWRILV
jgi:hypothetical protein